MFYRPDALPAAQPTVLKHSKSTHWTKLNYAKQQQTALHYAVIPDTVQTRCRLINISNSYLSSSLSKPNEFFNPVSK